MMRTWWKYVVGDPLAGTGRVRAQTYAEFAAQMGGFDADAASYASPERFFARWFTGLQQGRLEHYDRFLRRHVARGDRALSVGSGRCANELRLLVDGYDVTCSDLGEMAAREATERLFPQFSFRRLDFLRQSAGEAYDVIVSLGVIYAFDDGELDRFFTNVRCSLKPGGRLLIDNGGGADSVVSWCVDEGLLRVEAHLRWLVRRLRGEAPGRVTAVHHGYRRSDAEIVARAERHGMRLQALEHDLFTHELERSVLLSRLLPVPALGALLRRIGRGLPYVRLFRFDMVPDGGLAHA